MKKPVGITDEEATQLMDYVDERTDPFPEIMREFWFKHLRASILFWPCRHSCAWTKDWEARARKAKNIAQAKRWLDQSCPSHLGAAALCPQCKGFQHQHVISVRVSNMQEIPRR